MRLAVPLGCFAYILVRPVSNNAILLPVLAVLWLAAAVAVVFGRRRLDPACGTVLLVQLGFAAYALLRSVPGDHPGLLNGVSVTLVMPVLFWTVAWAADLVSVRLALRCLAWATVVLSGTVALYVANRRGVLPPLVPTSVLVGSGSGYNDFGDFTEIRFYGLSTLAAAGPLWIASLFVRDDLLPALPLRYGAAGSALVAALLGGRRGIVVAMLAAPALLWVCRELLGMRPGRSRRRLPAMLAALAAVYATGRLLFGVDPVVPVRNGLTGAGAALTDPASVLGEESRQLLHGWASAPLAGHGLGAVLAGYSRSATRPWSFELQYHLLLFQTGVVGLAAFVAVLALSVRALRRAGRSCPAHAPALLVCTVGAAAMLAVNTTDPYLQAPGHMWAVYLPLALGNAALTAGAARAGSHSTAAASKDSPRTPPASTGPGSPTSSAPSSPRAAGRTAART